MNRKALKSTLGLAGATAITILVDRLHLPTPYLVGTAVLAYGSLAVYARWPRSAATRPTADEWHQMEGRFGLVGREMNASWILFSTRKVQWSVTAVGTDGQREVERFLVEARFAGSLVRRMPNVIPKFSFQELAKDPADDWLNALAGVVEPDYYFGEGRDERGYHTTGGFRRAVDASKLLCARLALES